LDHKIQFATIIAGCEVTVVNIILGLICQCPRLTSDVFGHLGCVTLLDGL